MRIRALIAAATALLCAGCGSSATPKPSLTSNSTPKSTAPVVTASPTSAVPTGPIEASSFTRTDGSCPLIDKPAVLDYLGMRTAQITVLTRAGRTIGCEYYPDPDWIVREHLPAVTQPVLQITSVRYADALSAYNAMVRTGTAGGSAHQVSIGTGLIGIAYRARFDPPDGNTDWCYVFSKGVTVVTVKSAQADNELGPESVARAIAPKF